MLPWMNRLSICKKITLMMVMMLLVVMSILLYMVITKVSAMMSDQLDAYVAEAGQSSMLKVSEKLNSSLDSARSIHAAAAAVMDDRKIDRDMFSSMHKQFLLANPSILGAWSGWEPNALDGRDAEFVNATGYDKTGRFVPYWFRSKKGVELTPLVDYEVSGAGDYYQEPKKRLQETIIEPYEYEVDGEKVLMTSFAIPIMKGDKFVGVAGVDYSLANLQKEVGNIKPMGKGLVGLISSGNKWVVGLNAATTGKDVTQTEPAIAELIKTNNTKPIRLTLNSMKGPVQALLLPVNVGVSGQQWFIVVAIPMSVIHGPLQALSSALLGMGALAVLLMAVVCWFVLNRMLQRPMDQILNALVEIGRGNFNVKITASRRDDDIGVLSKAIEKYRDARAKETTHEAERDRQRQREQEMEDVRKSELLGLSQKFALVVGGTEAAHTGSANFNTVAHSTDEMFQAINSIAQQMINTQETIKRAVTESETVERDFYILNETSQKISEVIDFINEIASRTNLLALNASIEAARAGDAGRGFSIVAEEVKNLAAQTTKATENISIQVAEVQQAIKRSVSSIQAIGGTVTQINQATDTVAAAVEEQASTTKEIAASVQFIKGQAEDLLRHIQQS